MTESATSYTSQQSDDLNLRRFPAYLSLAVMFLYIFWFPGGMIGLLLTLFAFFMAMLAVNRIAIAIFFFHFGPVILGFLVSFFHLAGIGTLLSFCISALLLIKTKPIPVKENWILPVFWFIIIETVLFFSYFYGPQTHVCLMKWVTFTLMFLFFFYSIYILITNPKADFFQISFLFIIGSGILYAGSILRFPIIQPSSMFEITGMRLIAQDVRSEGILVATQSIGLMGCTGLVLLLGYISRKSSRKKGLFILAITFIAIIFLNSVGGRQHIFIPILILISTLFIQNKNKGTFLIIILIFTLFISIFIWVGLKNQNYVITKLFADERSFSHRVNRDTNWDAAIRRIEEEPIWGHGLGGYYVDGQTAPGDGMHAHNLFLELLSETGLVGTIPIVGFVAIFFVFRYLRKIPRFRTSNGSLILPLALSYFLVAMISHDLRNTFRIFAIVAAMWVYADFLSRPEKKPEEQP